MSWRRISGLGRRLSWGVLGIFMFVGRVFDAGIWVNFICYLRFFLLEGFFT